MNSSCVQVIPIEQALKEDKNLTLSEDNETWKYQTKDPRMSQVQFKNGAKMRHCLHYQRHGVIGVYDKTQVTHLDQMVYHGREALKTDDFTAEY